MTIGEVFKKEITRPIKGVITVGGSNDTSELKQELEEYVVTREILRHMRTFYSNYCKSLDGKTTDIGVWADVSGEGRSAAWGDCNSVSLPAECVWTVCRYGSVSQPFLLSDGKGQQR